MTQRQVKMSKKNYDLLVNLVKERKRKNPSWRESRREIIDDAIFNYHKRMCGLEEILDVKQKNKKK